MITRTLHLQVLPNAGKLEDLRYSASRFVLYTQHWLTQLFFNHHVKHLSTSGMGQLANQAQHRAIGILKAQREAAKETGQKSNCPQIGFTACPATIEKTHGTTFDYWVSFETQFAKKRVRIPAKSHKRLNRFLKKGWLLNPTCDLVKQKNGAWQVRVFVQKEAPAAEANPVCLGVDVGIKNSVSRSDGYLGAGLSRIIKRTKLQDAERRRQGHAVVRPKTRVKQRLDVEARRAVARCKRDGLSLAVENPKRLANLRSGTLHGWARSYFARRAAMIAEEEGIWITHVNPAYTSLTCQSCGYRDKRNRVKQTFECVSCGSKAHADINAARAIARKGSEFIRLRKQN
jgi:transcription elongation factor Elf1